MEENLIHIYEGIKIYVNVSIRNVKYVKMIIFGILLHVAVKMENIQQVFMDYDSAIMCDEIIESYDKERKKFPTNLNEEKVTRKTLNFYILLTFL